MSYDQVNPTFYQTFQPHTPFHAGGPGWTKSPWVTWGNNPNLAGRRTLATDGLGGCGCAGASGLGSILAISGLGAVAPVAPRGATMGNPASENCIAKGGKLQTVETPTGQSGICVLPDGTRCDEWALFRGQCGPATASMFPPIPEQPAWKKALSAIAGAACAYHGFKRNESPGWAAAWSVFGGAAPFLALPIALAQGFGKPARKAAMAANRRSGRARRR
jgi:hypothetical protein